MNEDSPENRLFELLMGAMYKTHPIQTPILGTRESIAQITPQVLTDCHRAFNRPDNMLLCVVGDVDPEQIAQMAEEMLQDAPRPQVTVVRQWDEALTVSAPEIQHQMEVAMPMFHLGFKCQPLPDGAEGVRMEIIGDLAAEALFGESSPLSLKLYEQGLIDGSFGGGFETVEGMAMLACTGDSDNPKAVQQAILEQAKILSETGIEETDFLRMKRSALGRRIRNIDSFDSTCFRICAYHFSKFDYFQIPDIYEQVTREDIRQFIKTVITPESMCMAVINPKEDT